MVAADSDGNIKSDLEDLMEQTVPRVSSAWYGATEDSSSVPTWKWVSECPGCTKGAPGKYKKLYKMCSGY